MNSITLTLPDTVYRQLEFLAQSEGVPLSQYLVNAILGHAVSGYRVRVTSEQERLRQRAEFLALLDRLGTVSEGEIDCILAEREQVESEPELSAETVSKIRNMIEESKRLKKTG